MAKKLTSKKAKEILHDGTVHGNPLTEKQRKYFGWVAGGGKAQAGKQVNPFEKYGTTGEDLKAASRGKFYPTPKSDLGDGYYILNKGKDKFKYYIQSGGANWLEKIEQEKPKPKPLPPKKTNQPNTLFVDNPNDPRLKSYQDSLKLYNLTKDVENPKYYKEGHKPSWYAWNKTTPEAEDFGRKHNMNNLGESPSKFPGKIKPVGVGDWEEGIGYPIYKKPVQPVVYKKDQPLPPLQTVEGRGARDMPMPNVQMGKAPDMSPKKTEYSYTYPTFDKDVQKTIYFSNEKGLKSFVDKYGAQSATYNKNSATATGNLLWQLEDNKKKGGGSVIADDGTSLVMPQDGIVQRAMSPGYQGLGYSNQGYNYNSAWGGRFQSGGSVSSADSVRHQANKILKYEQLKGGPGGSPLPNYSDPRYMDILMKGVYPEVKKIMPNASAMETGEAMDFIFNAGWDKNNNKITKDPRAYALQEYYKKYDPSKVDKEGKWPGRKNAPYSFDEEYANTIGNLPENERRVLMNKGRDWYYQNINNPSPGVPSSDYYDTWYGRIWNTNDYNEFNPNNPKLKHPSKKQMGGGLPGATGMMYARTGSSYEPGDIRRKRAEAGSIVKAQPGRIIPDMSSFNVRKPVYDATSNPAAMQQQFMTKEKAAEVNKRKELQDNINKIGRQTVGQASLIPGLSRNAVMEMNRQYASATGKRYDENSGAVTNRFSDNTDRTLRRADENIVQPMMYMEMAASAAPVLGQGLKAAGKYLTEETALSTPFKIAKNNIEAQKYRLIRFLDKEGKGMANEAVDTGNKWSQEWYSHPETLRRYEQFVNPEVPYSKKQAFLDKYFYFKAPPAGNAARQNLKTLQETGQLTKTQNKILVNPFDIFNREANTTFGYFNPIENKSFVDIYNPGQHLSRIPYTTIHENAHSVTGGVRGIKNNFNKVFQETFKPGVENFEKYLVKPTESYARMNELRRQFSLKPGQEVDDEVIDFILEKGLAGETAVDTEWFGLIKDKQKLKWLFNNVPAVAPLATGAASVAAMYDNKKAGGVIKDDMGQWAHPGEVTEIGTNDITMQGVPYPVLGVSDEGDTKVMMPGKNYKYKGKKVTEFPLAAAGMMIPEESEMVTDPIKPPKTPKVDFVDEVMNKESTYDRLPFKELVKTAAKQVGISPSLLGTSAYTEGMNIAAMNPKKVSGAYLEEYDKSNRLDGYPVDGFYNYGLDNFGTAYPDLLKKGYLPEDFDFRTFDAINEKGQHVTSAAFKNNYDALVAKAAFMKNEADKVESYARKLGLKLSEQEKGYFVMASYNGGFGNAMRMMNEVRDNKYAPSQYINEGKTRLKQIHKNVKPRYDRASQMGKYFEEMKAGGTIQDKGQLKKLDQLTNFTNYNNE